MDALVRAPPPPGSADPGDLYVDLQLRTLWLGVDQSVDQAGFVLISDIIETYREIEASLIEAKAYADQQDALRAWVDHTHLAEDITDLEDAVEEIITSGAGTKGGFVKGMIIMWSGSLADIGVGSLASWSLCDGSNGTPDLRDKFIMGAGNQVVGGTNPVTSFGTDVQGYHSHAGSTVGHVLSMAEMPYHNHGVTIGPNRFYGATYDARGAHNHSIWGPVWTGSYLEHDPSDEGDRGVHPNSYTHGSSTNGAHEHPCYVDIHAGYATDYRGSNYGHAHGIYGDGSHQHYITAAQIRDVLPYYALAYIMKL